MVEEIKRYFEEKEIINSKGNKINIYVDFLGENPTEFAIMKIPSNPIVETYIDGSTLRQFQFQLISCNGYGVDVMQNIANSNFYEQLYEKIENLNKKREYPNIKGIEKIECLDDGALLNTTTNTARYSIQMRILYYKEA